MREASNKGSHHSYSGRTINIPPTEMRSWRLNDSKSNRRESLHGAKSTGESQGKKRSQPRLATCIQLPSSRSRTARNSQPGYQAFARFRQDPSRRLLRGRAQSQLSRRRPQKQKKGRPLSAGFHSIMGYYRDDRPLYDRILDEANKKISTHSGTISISSHTLRFANIKDSSGSNARTLVL
ncbi:MAG: hypothetical protein M2R45_04262 [Verrucomicrobia subdivision 3 bacterium]|nr:hypothetical protein [Limisphaerales bacterium]MCS1412611.1 hypothetical protein [Limisphaerales bacterium]